MPLLWLDDLDSSEHLAANTLGGMMLLPSLRNWSESTLDSSIALLGTAHVLSATPGWNLPAGEYAFVLANGGDGWQVRSVVELGVIAVKPSDA